MLKHRKPLTPQELDDLQERMHSSPELDFLERREVRKCRALARRLRSLNPA
ncbi:MAG: hypothetical protein GAK43_01539 [Stenotrophomonas maltophilia]|nr:MAG: hypothetical protein GAK43_01539 [Stenotrophomonas maltophilia]